MDVFSKLNQMEYDSCGIVSVIEKKRVPSKKNIDSCLEALVLMNHRAGFTNGEGDGSGIHMDIPKEVWKEKLRQSGKDESLVDRSDFVVCHLFIENKANMKVVKSEAICLLTSLFNVIYENDHVTDPSVLGLIGKKQEPVFWQLGLIPKHRIDDLQFSNLNLTLDLERNESIHVVSLSHIFVVYKLLGAGDLLAKYYHDLSNPLVASTITLGHNRYSTNTASSFFRVQPFSIIGHNGEINTITQLRNEAKLLGVSLIEGASDSQDLNRIIETFISIYHLSLFETMEILFPPIINEIKQLPNHLKDMYTYLREAWGHFAQGPAAIISRFGNEAVFSLDSLGLRPLWMLETTDEIYFSSEQGIVSTSEFVAEPKPLAPGEKVGLRYDKDELDIYFYNDYQEEVYKHLSKKLTFNNSRIRLINSITQIEDNEKDIQVHNGILKANGWNLEQVRMITKMVEKGMEPIGSLGYDVALAALKQGRRNIPDFIQETVAVVTNPAIDREREIEHFSTRVVLGRRPSLFTPDIANVIQLISPIIIDLIPNTELSKRGHLSYQHVLSYFEDKKQLCRISITYSIEESIESALKRLLITAQQAVQKGATLIILDDEKANYDTEHLWIDPHLVTSYIDLGLTKLGVRRSMSLVLKSGALRSLHDIIVAIGLGADAINPYLMFSLVEPLSKSKLFDILNKGLEKIISTLGIHELRGYSRLFSSIGLNEEISEQLNITNFLGNNELIYDFKEMKKDSLKRVRDFNDEKNSLERVFHLYPSLWKSIGALAKGLSDYSVYRKKLREIEINQPLSIRHLLDILDVETAIKVEDVNIGIKNHDLPFIISSMSFGSQNETPFRAYAEAANQLNMISLNGEGGEIKDMIGRYPNTRGQQIASGRFGVNVELLNSSSLIEIKIGQGAKPGEGGHLPAAKVTDKIADSRNVTKGSDLISPSNNHDIYSIEDLSQIISEIKTASNEATISVKVPIVPNIGTIAVGIAKAGADVINLSGFDGGTGAARLHAIEHVGLPIEIGVKAVHQALVASGLRQQVEIWAEGGIRSSLDVVKLILLGANRVGFGTLAMIAVGCTTCRGCYLDTCHVGIATQIATIEEAKKRGINNFIPRQFESSVGNIKLLFQTFGDELKRLTAGLGFTNTQDMVGRSDLLIQKRGFELLDLNDLLQLSFLNSFIKTPFSKSKTNIQNLMESKTLHNVNNVQRNIGCEESCYNVRNNQKDLKDVQLSYIKGSTPGNGLGAYNSYGVHINVIGGGQDGVCKTALGGSVKIFKSKGKDGNYYNGSVGKGFAYGAQAGLFMIQGNADARAGIRLSGATIIIGGRITKVIKPNNDVNKGINANIKGFAFEYMTNGRAVVLGDPGPWICSGMTGGVVYLRVQEEMGLTVEVLESRIAKGAKIGLYPLSDQGKIELKSLLNVYYQSLIQFEQIEEAEIIYNLISDNIGKHFIQAMPIRQKEDDLVVTE